MVETAAEKPPFCCWSRAKRENDSHRSEHRFHSGTPFLTTSNWRASKGSSSTRIFRTPMV